MQQVQNLALFVKIPVKIYPCVHISIEYDPENNEKLGNMMKIIGYVKNDSHIRSSFK